MKDSPQNQQVEMFDWKRIFLSDEVSLLFLVEVLLRTGIMFLVVLVSLRLMGKRSINQLSFFELALTIALGEAAGEPMFHHDSPLIYAVAVFVIVGTMYKVIAMISDRNRTFEIVMEGKVVLLLREGLIDTKALARTDLSHDEFFAKLRSMQVEHLGQVRRVYIEASGEISVFFYQDEDVKWGLPILPEFYERQLRMVEERGTYACTHCGHVEEFGEEKTGFKCTRCTHPLCLKACDLKRVG